MLVYIGSTFICTLSDRRLSTEQLSADYTSLLGAHTSWILTKF
ncbi:hypothetical protein [Nostoc spongiaeforme]|nr:hypothetical protein [Nostoc spongiaeforme]